MARKPQRTELELPSGSTATIRKATARDMREAKDAQQRRNQSNAGNLPSEVLQRLREAAGRSPEEQAERLRQTRKLLDPDELMLQEHDAETLVDRCTISVDEFRLGDAVTDETADWAGFSSWFDMLDADDHAALFEGIMWFSRVRPSKKAS